MDAAGPIASPQLAVLCCGAECATQATVKPAAAPAVPAAALTPGGTPPPPFLSLTHSLTHRGRVDTPPGSRCSIHLRDNDGFVSAAQDVLLSSDVHDSEAAG